MSAYRWTSGVLVRRTPDRLLVLAEGRVHTLDGTAVDLFDALASPAEPEAIAQQLATRYEGVTTAVVREGLEALRQAGLVELDSR